MVRENQAWWKEKILKFLINCPSLSSSICPQISCSKSPDCRSQWPRGLRRKSAATRMLRSWVRIPPGAWMFVCCECCVLSGRGLCDELITRPEEFYRLCCVVVCDLETSLMRRPWPALGRSATGKKKSPDYIALINATLISCNVQIHENICSLNIFLWWYVLLLSRKNYVTKISYCSVRNNSVLENVLPFGQKHPTPRISITDHSALWMCYCSINKVFSQYVLLFNL